MRARPAVEIGRDVECQRVAGDDLQPARIVRGDFAQRRDRALVALDRDHARGAFGQQRARQPAGAGTDFEHGDAGERPAARAMRPVRLRSSRKFWPSDLRAVRPCRRMTSRSGGRRDRIISPAPSRPRRRSRAASLSAAIRLAVLGATGAGNVEGGAVVGRGAHEGQPERHVDGMIERERLDRDQRLIVIHRERRVVGRAARRHETSCRRAAVRARRCLRARNCATAGATTARSSSPSAPSSPACGLSPASARRGRAIPKRSLEIARDDPAGVDDQMRW